MSKSKKTISFISWNTEEFLKNQLDLLIKEQTITFYIYIYHYKEKDELENHFHVIMFPNKGIDYLDIRTLFTEQQQNGLLPLGISFKPNYVSKDCEYDWLLYVLHDKTYIKSKYKEVKRYVYNRDKLKSPDERTLFDMVTTAYHSTDFHKDKVINDLLAKGIQPHTLIKNGYIPIKDACSYHHYFEMLEGDYDNKKNRGNNY